MAILESEVWAGVNGFGKKYYENLDYKIPTYSHPNREEYVKRGTRILVKVEDLPINSGVIVTKICDICGDNVRLKYQNIMISRKERKDSTDRCRKCVNSEKLSVLNEEMYQTRNVSITHPEFASLFWNQEDTSTHTHQSNGRVDFRCPNCKENVGQRRVQDAYKYGISCLSCSDSASYPEKFMHSLLKQANIAFETQQSFSWSERKRYDFYLIEHNAIIETHGQQHYEGEHFTGLEYEQKNDKIKKNMAIANGIIPDRYIVVDCRRSTLGHMEREISSNLQLNYLLDISNINFLLCHEKALKSTVYIACELYRKGHKLIEIAKELKKGRKTIRGYLKQGVKIGLCDYTTDTKKEVVQLSLDGEYIREYNGVIEGSKVTGIIASSISSACTGNYKTAGGFKWVHKVDFDKLNENMKCGDD